MVVRNVSARSVMDAWLHSGQSVRMCGLDFRPTAHPVLKDTVQCIVKGQAAVYFLRQQTQGNAWLLKKFSPSRRPADAYLKAAHQRLPGDIAFFTCTQRRLLGAGHIDRRYSPYRDPFFLSWIEGTILMPKVPGLPWSSVADSIREGELNLTHVGRLRAALFLSKCIERLEAGDCAHRDLSGSNVFLDTASRIYLIDWDSLFHTCLPFQTNTTIGTPGYIAPFTRSPSGDWDTSRSWRPAADRYALAILIAEFLLTAACGQNAREDGSMFSQEHLDDPDGDPVQQCVDALWRLDRILGLLFWRAVHAFSFDRCPSPSQWRNTLSRLLNRNELPEYPDRVTNRDVRRPCSLCGATTQIPADRLAWKRDRVVPFVCATCQQARQMNRERAYPTVACEHCRQPTKIRRDKLDALRIKGSPILCSSCLRFQLDAWKREQAAWQQAHPEVACPKCGSWFRISEEKQATLKAQGKEALCQACMMNGRLKRNGDEPRRRTPQNGPLVRFRK